MKARLPDYAENFVLHHSGRTKIVAQKHQFLGENRAFGAFPRMDKTAGKLGVFRTRGARAQASRNERGMHVDSPTVMLSGRWVDRPTLRRPEDLITVPARGREH